MDVELKCAKGPILDVRDRESFLRSHLIGSTNIPWADLRDGDRAHELPPPSAECAEEGTGLTVVYNQGICTREELAGGRVLKAYAVVDWVEEERLVDYRTESGKDTSYLWKPNPSLGVLVDVIMARLEERALPLLALDLAAGNGRDVVFLAQRGFAVWAVDYQKRQVDKIDALVKSFPRDMCEALTHRFGKCVTSDMDMETDPPRVVIDRLLEWRGGPVNLIIISRYLHRPLFELVHELLNVGGLVCIHTFMVGAESVGKKTPTKPRFLLQPGELRRMFEPHFDVLVDDVIHLTDGRPTSSFLARRRE